MRKRNWFTLIELLIVIAIIAILAAVLAPQYIRYVEQSRRSSDISSAQTIIDACQVVAVDPTVDDDSFVITWACDGDTATGGITQTGLDDADFAVLTGIIGTSVTPSHSDFADTAGNLVITVASGIVTVNGTDGDTTTWAGALDIDATT